MIGKKLKIVNEGGGGAQLKAAWVGTTFPFSVSDGSAMPSEGDTVIVEDVDGITLVVKKE